MTEYQPRNILDSGGPGLTGSNYLRHMLATYPEVNITNLDKLTAVIAACQQQKRIPIYGDGSNIRDWLYVQDHFLIVTSTEPSSSVILTERSDERSPTKQPKHTHNWT